MKIKETTLPVKAAAQKDNPYVELVKPFVEKGVDTPFAIETTVAEHAADTLQIQDAVRRLGHTARVAVKPDFDPEVAKDTDKVEIKFLIRPARKPKGSADAAPEADAAE